MSKYGMRTYKLIILGKGGIGKSELVQRFVKPNKRFHSTFDPTVEDQYHLTETVDDKRTSLEVIDVGGFGQFHTNQDIRIRECDGFLLAYGIDDKESFDELSDIYNQIIRVRDTDRVAILLVGTKLDLGETERQVTIEEVKNLARNFKCDCIETSAKSSINVPETFHKLVRTIIKMEAPPTTPRSPLLCCFPLTDSQRH